MVLGLESGCTKKDDVVPAAGATGLVGGTWDLTSFVQSACSDPAMNKSTPCVGCKTLTFKSDGTYFETIGSGGSGGGFPGTYTISGGNLTFDDVSSGPTETYPFTVTATTLTFITFINDCTNQEVFTRK